MNLTRIKQILIAEEGIELDPYKCPAGKLTIGVGHNLERGITKRMAMFILEEDIKECIQDLQLKLFPVQFPHFPIGVQTALINCRFVLGPKRFRGFEKMIAAVRVWEWPNMVKELRDSRWYRKYPSRVEKIIKEIEND